MKPGLYIVGTPIGNLGDMSPRALDALKEMDLVLCEDTRVTGKLLSHFGIKVKMQVYADYNERDNLSALLAKIGHSRVAIVSDSGMPGISDPGYRLIRAAREKGLFITAVPGPAAFLTALVLSGFPTDKFTFLGFFKSESALREDNRLRHTIIYYESPNRIMETIAILARVCPERQIAIVREITKLYEETIIGYPADLADIKPPKGEIVIVIAPAPDAKPTDDEITEIVKSVVGMKTKDAAGIIADRTGMSKKEAYDKILSTND